MAIFVNSWPAGIALSLLTLPLIGTTYGVYAVRSLSSQRLSLIGIAAGDDLSSTATRRRGDGHRFRATRFQNNAGRGHGLPA